MRIVTPWRDRQGYLTIMLATLKEAMRDHNDVHVTLYNNESKAPPPEICNEFSSLEHRTVSAFDCHHVFINMFNEEFERCDDDYILNIDSDCCIHPYFIHAVKELVQECPDFGHASFYNEGNHPEPPTILMGKYHVRDHISMTASLIRRGAWEAFKKPTPGSDMRDGCIDGALSWSVSESTEWNCYSTVRSYVEHIGATGAYAQIDDGGISHAHRARRFYP